MTEPAAPQPSFEEAMDRLEKIVDAMESGEIPLEQLLAQFEEGSRLLRHCEGRLKAAEMRIDLLRKGAAGPTLTPFTQVSAPKENEEF